MITIVSCGLGALVVLAAAVGLFDAAQRGRLRSTARERRAAWELRRREERVVATPDAGDD